MKFNDNLDEDWEWGGSTIMAATYICGYCGAKVTSEKGMSLKYATEEKYTHSNSKPYGVFVCTNCHMPSFIFRDIQVPGSEFGNVVSGAPDNVTEIYNEARKSFSVQSYTAVILLARILLSHVAVSLGANDVSNFAKAVDFLKDNNYIPNTSEEWIDSIRKVGNRTNHELTINTKEEAETIIKFCEMLLKINYEYPNIAKNMLETKEE